MNDSTPWSSRLVAPIYGAGFRESPGLPGPPEFDIPISKLTRVMHTAVTLRIVRFAAVLDRADLIGSHYSFPCRTALLWLPRRRLISAFRR